MFTILILSGYPGDKVPSAPFFGFDKVVHVSIYLILSILMLFGLLFSETIKKVTLKLQVVVSFSGILFGGLMEICQHYIFINRSGNWYDFIANAIGALLGVILYPHLLKLLPFKR